MKAKTRNFVVGATVLASVIVFLWMFLRFGTKSATLFAPPQTSVEIDAPRVDGLSEGSALTYQGVSVGRVIKIERNPTGNGVKVSALLVTQPPIPINVNAEIVTTNLIGGGAQIALSVPTDPKTHQEVPPLFSTEPFPKIQATYVGLKLNLIPSQYTETAEKIAVLSESITEAAREIHDRNIVQHLDEAVQTITAQANRAGDTMKTVQDFLGDPAVQRDMRTTLVNVRDASANVAKFSATLPDLSKQASEFIANTNGSVSRTESHIDDLTKQLSDSLASATATLNTIHDITDKIDKGQGAAGQLVNDPKLYQNLIESSQALSATLKDSQRLFEQWEQEGLSLKLK
jgi:phospholipid/cholesterol/gamma-HCH transport system substrate-binding protein